jgi:DNA-directed RNA polymerase subunit K/omega
MLPEEPTGPGEKTLSRSALYHPHRRHRDHGFVLAPALQKSVNGSFHKTALLQRRVRELVRGSAPLLETRKVNPIEIAFLEMERGLIELVPDEDALRPLPTLLIPDVPTSPSVPEMGPPRI